MLSAAQIRQIVQEIEDDAEVNRRAQAKRRFDIYRDGGRAFLVEKILREFGQDALSEMRLTPLNLLKKMVDKRAGIYKRAPTRLANNPSNQALVDHYVNDMAFNVVMQKANKYLVLAANTSLYIRPQMGRLVATVVPNYLYSIIPNSFDQTKVDTVIFSMFADEGRVASQAAPYPGTGFSGFSEERGYKYQGDLVASNEKESKNAATQLVFWSAEEHFTTNGNGDKYGIAGEGQEQWLNPIQLMPVINIARDRDNEPWATNGEDMIDLTMALQLGWTDVMTIAKHQGFSLLTITSETEPKRMNIGVNRAVWLKMNPGGPQPSIGYVQANSPLEQYKGLLIELLGLLLTTNNMEPGAIGGQASAKNFTSGFHALISMADSLEAIESDKPLFADAEQEAWDVIKAWHNYMFDAGMLADEARALGKFTDDFKVSVVFADIKPLESDDERIARVKSLMDLGLITKRDALKKLHPDMTPEQIEAKLAEIQAETMQGVASAADVLQSQSQGIKDDEPDAVEGESDNG